MRKNVLAGLCLAATSAALVLLGSALDLELQPVALTGAAIGAVLALVAAGTPAGRLAGFAVGVGATWVGYLVRAQYLPDTEAGRAVFAGLVVVLAAVVVLALRDRLPLWSVLLGAGVFAGSYEATYAAAPPQLLSTSLSTATTLLCTLGAGFLVASLVGPAAERAPQAVAR